MTVWSSKCFCPKMWYDTMYDLVCLNCASVGMMAVGSHYCIPCKLTMSLSYCTDNPTDHLDHTPHVTDVTPTWCSWFTRGSQSISLLLDLSRTGQRGRRWRESQGVTKRRLEPSFHSRHFWICGSFHLLA